MLMVVSPPSNSYSSTENARILAASHRHMLVVPVLALSLHVSSMAPKPMLDRAKQDAGSDGMLLALLLHRVCSCFGSIFCPPMYCFHVAAGDAATCAVQDHGRRAWVSQLHMLPMCMSVCSGNDALSARVHSYVFQEVCIPCLDACQRGGMGQVVRLQRELAIQAGLPAWSAPPHGRPCGWEQGWARL